MIDVKSIPLEELLYVGSVVQTFSHAPGTMSACTNDSMVEMRTTELEELARARRTPASFLGPSYSDLLLPATPCIDVVVVDEKLSSACSPRIPELLRRPLVKTLGGEITGVASGVRSALIRASAPDGSVSWYRLKGCGNNYDGFPTQKVEHTVFEGCVEIRGCQFKHTSTRELFMAGLIDDVLRGAGHPGSAITPIGWYEYAMPKDSRVLYPDVVRTCAVFKADGERRCGDHVIIGLERLLPILCDRTSLSELPLKFPASRQCTKDDYPELVIPTWLNAVTGMYEYFDATDVNMSVRAPIDPPEFVDDMWKELWSAAAKTFNDEMDGRSHQNCLAYVYWKLGREMGSLLALIHEEDISWGTYEDSLGIHCNAHTNNFVLRPPSPGGEMSMDHWLSMLDFDLAYTRSSYVGQHGESDDTSFDRWISTEASSLKIVLAGDDQINSGVAGTATLPHQWLAVKWALRDTIVIAFQEGYARKRDRHPTDPSMHVASHALIRLALMATSHVVA